jgi:hypothetical protein
MKADERWYVSLLEIERKEGGWGGSKVEGRPRLDWVEESRNE